MRGCRKLDRRRNIYLVSQVQCHLIWVHLVFEKSVDPDQLGPLCFQKEGKYIIRGSRWGIMNNGPFL